MTVFTGVKQGLNVNKCGLGLPGGKGSYEEGLGSGAVLPGLDRHKKTFVLLQLSYRKGLNCCHSGTLKRSVPSVLCVVTPLQG